MGQWIAEQSDHLARPYGLVEARRARFPELAAACEELLDVAQDFFDAATSSTTRHDVEWNPLMHRHEAAVRSLEAAIASLLADGRRWRRRLPWQGPR